MIDKFWEVYKKIGAGEKYLLVFVGLGVFVVITSLFRGVLGGNEAKIEYIKAENEQIGGNVIVDIEGAIKNPGVYELPTNSRIKDVLVMSGGFVEKTDRDYCEKTLNMASILKDGQKIYIPFVSDTPNGGGYIEAKSESKMVNINTATNAELDTLWGIGSARIESIVKNRPYQSLDELVEKKVLTKQILEKNKDKITLF